MHSARLGLTLAGITLISLTLVGLSASASFAAPSPQTIVARDASSAVVFDSLTSATALTVRVQSPDGTIFETRAEGSASFPLASDEGAPRADGIYSWEVVATTPIGSELRAQLDAARGADDRETFERLRAASEFAVERASGSFWIREGALVIDDGATLEPSIDKTSPAAIDSAGLPLKDDVLTNFNGIIRNSLCVGNDCEDPEPFVSDTIRMKENNIRIHFEDTSSGASFPSADWRIVANSDVNGGGNYLAFEDSTAGTLPFVVEANAGASALHVNNGGRVGLGTSVPSVELHIVDGNTPAVRLEQDGSAGFGPQIWDLAGNETSFFLRDQTNGSTLPFRVFPGEPSDALVLRDGIGVGILAPDAALHVSGSDADTFVRVTNKNIDPATREVFVGENNGPPRFSIENTDSGDKWFVGQNGNGALTLSKSGTPANEMRLNGLDAGANPGRATFQGDVVATNFVNASDRNRKTALRTLDVSAVLAKVLELPITEWQFRHEPETVRHVGPMAQDFHAAFGLGGDDDRHIGTVDAAGVALAAIQGLGEQLAAKDRAIEELRAENDALAARLDALEQSLR